MDDTRRAILREALDLIRRAKLMVEGACDKENDCIDNYPENLQSTEVFEKMEIAADAMEDAVEKLSEAEESITTAIQK